jgi:uncharacterized protein YciI
MRWIFLLLISSLTFAADAQKYNKALADSLGSDDNGMKRYTLAILKTGPNVPADKLAIDSLFKGHISNMERLAKEGKLIVGGPFKKNSSNFNGIFILNVPTIEEARVLVNTDPAVSAGAFEVDIYEWYGSAALPLYLPYHDVISKKHQ